MNELAQTETAVEQLQIEPLPATDPAIGRALWQLEGARGRLKELLATLNPDWLDWEPYPGGNSIGTLLYHIALIEIDWLFAEVLEQEYSEAAKALLPYPDRDKSGRLFGVTAVSLPDHLQRLDTARQMLLDVFTNLSLADFRRARQLPHYHVTPEWVLFHLTQHETEHRGQIGEIISWRKQHGREDSQSL
ncbi:MAG: DinB family protein [Anaerolineaceae bacterium]|nr:DinB family protein [Anaerolineaceae bacterium]